MNEYTKDYGKVGITFAAYAEGHAVEELTMVAYNGELYVSLVGTVMSPTMPASDWYKVTDFADLVAAIRQAKAEAEGYLTDIEAIRAAASAALEGMADEINAKLADIDSRAAAIIERLNQTNTTVTEAERLRKEAEQLRITAEGARRDAENARMLAEKLRDTEEQARKNAEAGRVKTDNDRKEDWARLQTRINTTIDTADDAAARAVAAVQGCDAAIARANAAAQNADNKAAYAKTEGDKIAPAIAQMQQTFTTNETARQKTASDQRKSEKQTFDQQIAQQDATFQGKEAQRDAAVAEATKVSATVQTHTHAISHYSKHNPLPLTANLARGKMLVMEGDMVVMQDREGWGITRVDSSQFAAIGLTMGDTILLPMAHMDAEGKPVDNLMVTGAVLFAAEEVIRDAQGEVIYTRRTSLFRASNDEIATWGGVKKWLAIADGESLLICHPLDITEATVTRNGNDAANAAADLNQRRRIDEKFTRGGYDPDAMVGWAGRLTPTEKTESAAYKDELLPAARLIGYAPELGSIGAGDSIAERVSPVMREVAGVACGVNQYCDDPFFEKGKTGWQTYAITANVESDGTIHLVGTQSSSQFYKNKAKLPVGSKVMSLIIMKGKLSQFKFSGCINIQNVLTTNFTGVGGIGEVIENSNTDWMDFYVNGGECWIKALACLNLTLLPQLSDLLPTLGRDDANKVAHRLGFFALQRD